MGPSLDESSEPSDAAVLVEFGAAVERMCRSRLLSPTDVEDAVQDTFVRFLTRRERAVKNPEAWLMTAARRACQDLIRRRARRREDEVPEGLTQEGVCPVDDSVTTATLLRSLLDSLSARDARLLSRLYLGGWTCEDVARELGVPAVHVRMMAVRARRHAKKAFDRLGVDRGAFGLVPWLMGSWQRLHSRTSPRRPRPSGVGPSMSARLSDAIAVPGCAMGDCVAAILAAALVLTSGSAAVPASAAVAVREQSSTTRPGPVTPSQLGATGRSATAGGGQLYGSAPSASPVTSGPLQVLSQTIAGKQTPQQQDAEFYSFTPSPGYAHDHTVYASGQQFVGCTTICPVPVLFVSHDGGANWQYLPAASFDGGQIFLPPAYPLDPTIFAIGRSGLQRSTLDGMAFTTVAPRVTGAAMEPDAPAGQAHILLATVPLTVYSEATGLISVGPTLPTGVTSILSLAYVGDGQHVLVAGQRLDPAAPGEGGGMFATCTMTVCSTSAVYPGNTTEILAVSPTESRDHTVAAMVGNSLVMSADRGTTFHDVRLPDGAQPFSVMMRADYATSKTLLVGATETKGQVWTATILAKTTDGGASFLPLASPGLPWSFAVTMLPDGRLLDSAITPDSAGTFGIRCSMNGGLSWLTTCT